MGNVLAKVLYFKVSLNKNKYSTDNLFMKNLFGHIYRFVRLVLLYLFVLLVQGFEKRY